MKRWSRNAGLFLRAERKTCLVRERTRGANARLARILFFNIIRTFFFEEPAIMRKIADSRNGLSRLFVYARLSISRVFHSHWAVNVTVSWFLYLHWMETRSSKSKSSVKWRIICMSVGRLLKLKILFFILVIIETFFKIKYQLITSIYN